MSTFSSTLRYLPFTLIVYSSPCASFPSTPHLIFSPPLHLHSFTPSPSCLFLSITISQLYSLVPLVSWSLPFITFSSFHTFSPLNLRPLILYSLPINPSYTRPLVASFPRFLGVRSSKAASPVPQGAPRFPGTGHIRTPSPVKLTPRPEDHQRGDGEPGRVSSMPCTAGGHGAVLPLHLLGPVRENGSKEFGFSSFLMIRCCGLCNA